MAASDQKVVQRWNAAQVGGRGIDGNGAKLECVSDRVVSEEGEHVGSEIQHHQVGGIFLSHQPAGEQGEACLHEQDEVTGIQCPGKIRRNANVTDTVGQLYRERLFRGLSLIFIECFLVRGIVGSCLVGGLGDDKGIAGSIHRGDLVPCSCAGWIGPGPIVGKAVGR